VFSSTSENELQRPAAQLGPTDLNPSPETHSFSYQPETGILIVGHGSRRTEANMDVRQVARRIAERGRFALVEAAFLEIEHPNVAEGFGRLVERGARKIIVHPYFLSPGRHTRGDLPRELSEIAALHPDVSYRITEPLSGHSLVIRAAIERIRETDATSLPEHYREAEGATVYLVGAGPGDPGLLTLRARDLLASCDCVLYDHLVNPKILRLAPPNADRIAVGKVGGAHGTPQTQINQILIERARLGKRVVRLKGGDPFLFGRGGEEAEALHDAGIGFEVVPGVTSALAVPAHAGIPLTHRGYSSSVAVVTGAHAGAGACSSDALSAVARAETIVVLMGLSNLREIAAHLIDLNKSPHTPVAVIHRGTYQTQQTIIGTLGSIGDAVDRAGFCAPAVIVIGEVVRLRERLNWFAEEPAQISEPETALAAA
jgi:uroporphyrin-III C-methyltransferase